MHRSTSVIAVGAALVLVGGAASAAPCYSLFDRNDNVIYRGTVPPVDMSAAGAAARDALRERGQYLMFVDSPSCPLVEFRFGDAGSRTLSMDEVVGGLAPSSSQAISAGSAGRPAATTTRPRRP